MIDRDAIKAPGLNRDAHSVQLLVEHERRRRVELHADLCWKIIRANPGLTVNELDPLIERAVVEAGL